MLCCIGLCTRLLHLRLFCQLLEIHFWLGCHLEMKKQKELWIGTQWTGFALSHYLPSDLEKLTSLGYFKWTITYLVLYVEIEQSKAQLTIAGEGREAG